MKSLLSKILLLLFCLSTIHCNKVSFSSIEDAIKDEPSSPPPVVVVVPPPVIIEPPAQLDILVVIDNSSSMLPEHAIIAEKLQGFTSKLTSIDYQIAVTTTDARVDVNGGFFSPRKQTPRGFGGKALLFNESNFVSASTVEGESLLLASLDRSQEASCSNPEDTEEEDQNYWEEKVQSEICSTDTIEPLKVVQLFLEQQNTVNAGFLRSNSSLAVLIISDEDLNSTESESVGLATRLRAIKALKPNMKAYGIIAQENDISNCQANWSGQTSKQIQDFITLSGGTHHSICDDDYTSIFDTIVQDLR